MPDIANILIAAGCIVIAASLLYIMALLAGRRTSRKMSPTLQALKAAGIPLLRHRENGGYREEFYITTGKNPGYRTIKNIDFQRMPDVLIAL